MADLEVHMHQYELWQVTPGDSFPAFETDIGWGGCSSATTRCGPRRMKFVVRQKERGALDPGLVGNKARNLAFLARKGLPVPRFFCVTTLAFRRFVESAGSEWLPPDGARDVLLSSPVPEEVAGQIADEYEGWGEVLLAVRSSATGEDSPDVSWAGQLETLLWVRGLEHLLEGRELRRGQGARTELAQEGLALIVRRLGQLRRRRLDLCLCRRDLELAPQNGERPIRE